MRPAQIPRRLAGLSLSLLAVVTAVFLMMRALPGDPVEAMLAEAGAPPEQVQLWRRRYGLDRSLAIQYVLYLGSLARGDLGESILYRRPVTTLIGEQFPSTAALSLAAFAVALVLGGSLGMAGALGRGTPLDWLSRLLAVGSVSLPTYWTGILAVMAFSAGLRWFPASGEGSWRHLVLPALTLGLASAGVVARVTRVAVLEAASSPHVQVARSKGLPDGLLLVRHVLRNAAPTVVTLLGLQAGFLLAGTAITETVFSRRGVGRLLVQAVVTKDYPLAQGCIMFAALTYTLANAISDVAAAWLDPRVREP
ncbi:MAG: ABC transporter permease [Anaerolineae bacterium]|nr:ABC transporter permease [Anaerolineae bacterium]